MPAPTPQKKFQPPQVELQFDEIKVLEGVSEHETADFLQNFLGFRPKLMLRYIGNYVLASNMYYSYIQGLTIIQWCGCASSTSPKML